jgi:hypothetical protein
MSQTSKPRVIGSQEGPVNLSWGNYVEQADKALKMYRADMTVRLEELRCRVEAKPGIHREELVKGIVPEERLTGAYLGRLMKLGYEQRDNRFYPMRREFCDHVHDE